MKSSPKPGVIGVALNPKNEADMKTLKTILAATLLAAPWLTGCAGMRLQPFPAPTGPVKVSFYSESPDARHDKAEWPMGTYRVPGSNVFMADLQGDEPLPYGELTRNAEGKEKVVGEGAEGSNLTTGDLAGSLRVDTVELAQRCLGDQLAQEKEKGRFTLVEGGEGTALRIFPYLVFSNVDKGKARLWVVLKASYGEPGAPEWECRYLSGLGLPRTFLGENGWGSRTGKQLQKDVEWNLRAAFQAMLRDLNGKLRLDNPPRQNVRGCWAFYHKPLTVDAQVLGRTPDRWIVLPVAGDEYFSGINVLPEDFTEDGLSDPHQRLK